MVKLPLTHVAIVPRVAALMIGLSVLVFPVSASAATTIGQLDPGTPGASCVGTSYWVQDTSAGPSYLAPAAGVVSTWSHKANAATGRELGLRVFRLVSGTTYTLVGSSGVQTLTASSVNSFLTRIPVQAGDRLGLYVGNLGFPIGGGASCAFSGGVGDLMHQGSANPEVATGSNASLASTYSNIYLLNVTASIEPDADGDGYGDETQDGCATSASTQGACPTANPAPETPQETDKTPPHATVATKRYSVKDHTVSVRITTDEAATATVNGTINVANASKVYRLKRSTASLEQNVATKLKLRISKKARGPIRRALKRHRKIKAKLTISLKDAAGNTSTVKSTVSLRL